MGVRVFLSYSVAPADRPLLDHVEKECSNLGIGLYLAEREFSPTTVSEKLRGAIRTSDCVVVLLTASGSASSWVNQEIAIANEMSKPIVPLLEEGVEAPGLIRERDQIRFSREGFSEAFDRATRFIGSLRGQPSEPAESSDNTDLLVGIAIGAVIVVLVVLIVLAFSRE
jgi:hypothetical protein